MAGWPVRLTPGAPPPRYPATRDGRSGKVVIDGHEFDLTRGGLFLVSAKGTPVRVEQIPVDAAQLQPCADGKRFPELAPADPRIATFLQSSKVGE